jgi:hypothetical protein
LTVGQSGVPGHWADVDRGRAGRSRPVGLEHGAASATGEQPR